MQKIRRTLIFFVVTTVTGTLTAREMTSPDVARLNSVREVQISPDGASIAYVRGVQAIPFAEESAPVRGELRVVTLAGSDRGYVSGPSVSNISWSRDGAFIYFLSKRGEDEKKSLWRIPLAGGESQRVLGDSSGISAYEISPDGKRVACLVADTPEEKVEALEKAGFDAIVYEENLLSTRIRIATMGGDEEWRLVELEGHVKEVHWLNDETLVVAHTPSPLVDDEYVARRIRFWSVDDGKEVGRIENEGKLGMIRPSPDGERIAAIAATDMHDPKEGRLIVGGPDGSFRDIIPGLEGHVSGIEWLSADEIAFIVDRGVGTSIETIGVDGSKRKTLFSSDQLVGEKLSIAGNGRIALVMESAKHPDEAFVIEERSRSPRRLTDTNPWLSEIDLGVQEIVEFEARDGLSLQGILIRPVNEKGRHPLIMAVHGGPESHHENGWLTSSTYPGQVAAGKGYAVFYTNYRGSTGRGVEFSKLSQGDPAGKEFDDIVDAVDHLVDIGLADEDRVGITGGSYGGYATAWGATYYSDRYRAAVMNVGISEKLSKFGTSDIPRELNYVHDLAYPWEKWDLMRERSPIYHVEKARTPILIMHGQEDTRVHPTQSMILYRYLKLLDKTPVRLVLYPGEGHGNKKSAARLDYNLRMMRWFDHFLMGDSEELPPADLEYPRSELEN